MTGQVLDHVLRCYRIGDPNGDYPIFDATGSRLAPGRWNTANSPVIYASEHYSTAMLEQLVHGSGCLPPNQHYIEITIPNGVTYEQVTADLLPGWADQNRVASRQYGERWLMEKRSLILLVPSLVARPERNVLINPLHEDFHKITCDLAIPVYWDSRLF